MARERQRLALQADRTNNRSSSWPSGDRLLVCHPGADARTHARRIRRAIFLGHYYSDHIGAIGDHNINSWAAGRGAPLEIVGPEGVEEVVAGFNRAFALDAAYRTEHGSELMPPELGVLAARTVEPGLIHDEGGLRIRAFPVDHSPVATLSAIASTTGAGQSSSAETLSPRRRWNRPRRAPTCSSPTRWRNTSSWPWPVPTRRRILAARRS